MPEPSVPKRRMSARPRSKSFLRIDVRNAYARLGVSPLASTDEIASHIAELRSAAVKRLKAKGNTMVDDPDQQEVFRLDRIEEEIGDPRKRNTYDDRHPQNILLTVQPSTSEQAWLRHRRAGLISDWVYGELGLEALAPTPACLRLWAPRGVDPGLLKLAMESAGGAAIREVVSQGPVAEPETMILFEDLEGFSREK